MYPYFNLLNEERQKSDPDHQEWSQFQHPACLECTFYWRFPKMDAVTHVVLINIHVQGTWIWKFKAYRAPDRKSRGNADQSISQFSHSVMFDSLWAHGLRHTRPLCPSPTPRVYSNSCPLSLWCHPTISSSIFFSHPQSFPASGSFPRSQFFTLGLVNTTVDSWFLYYLKL